MNVVAHGTMDPPLRARVQRVSAFRPIAWLRLGRADLKKCALQDAAHAGLMIVLGWVLLIVLGAHPYLVAAALSGFLLGAPVMTTGLVELSRRLERREATTFNDSVMPLERDGPALVNFGVALAGFAAVWFVASGALLSAVLNVPAPNFVDTFYRGFLDTATRAQLWSYVAVGAALALIVFVLSVVTVPSIIDQHATARQAMRLSFEVVRTNPLAMLVWSALIVTLTAVGFVTMLFGMLIVIPLLSHATWHAYRELVRI